MASYHMTAKQAATTLGITLPTLYAYTSRGQLRSEPSPGNPRERRYLREDVERLRERKEVRRDPSRAAARGLHWGSPVLSSGITLIHNGRLYYRGRDAVRFAETATLEEAAALLWEAGESENLFNQPPPSYSQVTRTLTGVKDPFVRIQAALPIAGAVDASGYDSRPAAVRQTGARIVRLFTSILAGRVAKAPAHVALQSAWAPGKSKTAEALRTALVLCADHELNVSAFTARCAASAGASVYDAISAGMAALKGSRHGGETKRVSALLAEIATPRSARRVLADRMRRGEKLPGFGHPLYPDGDPRGALLMRLAEAGPNRAEWKLLRSVREAGLDLMHDHVNLDFGLVAMARTHGLPDHAPLMLFALGRTTGWVAHIMEQYASDEMIRPRAHYVGPAPGIGPDL